MVKKGEGCLVHIFFRKAKHPQQPSFPSHLCSPGGRETAKKNSTRRTNTQTLQRTTTTIHPTTTHKTTSLFYKTSQTHTLETLDQQQQQQQQQSKLILEKKE